MNLKYIVVTLLGLLFTHCINDISNSPKPKSDPSIFGKWKLEETDDNHDLKITLDFLESSQLIIITKVTDEFSGEVVDSRVDTAIISEIDSISVKKISFGESEVYGYFPIMEDTLFFMMTQYPPSQPLQAIGDSEAESIMKEWSVGTVCGSHYCDSVTVTYTADSIITTATITKDTWSFPINYYRNFQYEIPTPEDTVAYFYLIENNELYTFQTKTFRRGGSWKLTRVKE